MCLPNIFTQKCIFLQVWIKRLWLCSWKKRVKCFSWVKADNAVMWWQKHPGISRICNGTQSVTVAKEIVRKHYNSTTQWRKHQASEYSKNDSRNLRGQHRKNLFKKEGMQHCDIARSMNWEYRGCKVYLITSKNLENSGFQKPCKSEKDCLRLVTWVCLCMYLPLSRVNCQET